MVWDCKTARPQDRKTARPQDCKTARPQDCKTARPQDRKTARLQDRKTARPQDRKTASRSGLSDYTIISMFTKDKQTTSPLRQLADRGTPPDLGGEIFSLTKFLINSFIS